MLHAFHARLLAALPAGVHVWSTDLIGGNIGMLIDASNGQGSNREIFLTHATLDSNWRGLAVADDAYVSVAGCWTASSDQVRRLTDNWWGVSAAVLLLLLLLLLPYGLDGLGTGEVRAPCLHQTAALPRPPRCDCDWLLFCVTAAAAARPLCLSVSASYRCWCSSAWRQDNIWVSPDSTGAQLVISGGTIFNGGSEGGDPGKDMCNGITVNAGSFQITGTAIRNNKGRGVWVPDGDRVSE